MSREEKHPWVSRCRVFSAACHWFTWPQSNCYSGSCLLTELVFGLWKVKVTSKCHALQEHAARCFIFYAEVGLFCSSQLSVIHSEGNNFVVLVFVWRVEQFCNQDLYSFAQMEFTDKYRPFFSKHQFSLLFWMSDLSSPNLFFWSKWFKVASLLRWLMLSCPALGTNGASSHQTLQFLFPSWFFVLFPTDQASCHLTFTYTRSITILKPRLKPWYKCPLYCITTQKDGAKINPSPPPRAWMLFEVLQPRLLFRLWLQTWPFVFSLDFISHFQNLGA